jgi:hypothetical protein
MFQQHSPPPQSQAMNILSNVANPYMFEALGKAISALQLPADHALNSKAARLLESIIDATQGHLDEAILTLNDKAE